MFSIRQTSRFGMAAALLAALLIFSMAGEGVRAAPPTPDGPARPDIVGGTEAAPGAWPWQVLIQPGQYQCGGSLVNSGWVLTAAHCFFTEQGDAIPAGQTVVRVGVHNQASDPPEGQQIAAAEVILHPDYLASGKKHGDVALIRLAEPAALGGNVGLATLAVEADAALAAPGVMATVTGWGNTSEGGQTSDVLKQVSLPVVSNETCANSYSDIIASHLCAGGNAGEDSCQGDSGGPLVAPNAAQNGFIQIGIVSYGQGCGQAGVPGVYERVSSYICWLNQTSGLTLGACGTQPPPPPPPDANFKVFLPVSFNQSNAAAGLHGAP